MDELKIKGFENLIVEACNKTPIPNKIKYYVLREIAQECLKVSETEVQIALSKIPQESEVAEDGN